MHKRYQNARFVTSAASVASLPPETGAEVAFAGRSNAGKSSALNRICYQKALARTSKTPGRTQQINFFDVGEGRHLVDLPGYGYARVEKSRQRQWGAFLQHYLLERGALRGLILLMDIRHPLTPLDEQLLDLCREAGVPVHVLLTKSDKLKRGQATTARREVKKRLEAEGLHAEVQLFSALNGEGLEAVQARLDDWLGFGTPADADAAAETSGPEAG